jgi:hypothetical protein
MISSRIRRQIGSLLGSGTASSQSSNRLNLAGEKRAATNLIPPELSPHQYAVLLLHIAAEIEHALMVVYLYAGFSLGGPQVPEERRIEVGEWRETILGIAKEEMGHLMTVQNLLRCLGGPLNLDREDYPWDSEFYPFPFRLEPLSRQSLAKYVYAESPPPDQWVSEEANEIRALAKSAGHEADLHRVGLLYEQLESLFDDPAALKDADFRGSTYPFQANGDEWGRGYQSEAHGNGAGAAAPKLPDVILMPVTCRTDALRALKAIATQGEANPTADDGAPSHFARFLDIFRKFPKASEWQPSMDVPVNPIVVTNLTDDEDIQPWAGTPITNPAGQLWAHLFNVRYQALLTNLLHTFEYPNNLSETSQLTPRGLLIHSTFGEMYNLRSLSQVLMQTPLSSMDLNCRAGPPFQMPYTLKLPVDSCDRWRVHLDLLSASESLVDRLLQTEHGNHRTYLLALREADRQTSTMIESISRGRSIPTSTLARHH